MKDRKVKRATSIEDKATAIFTDAGIPPVDIDVSQGVIVVVFNNEAEANRAGELLVNAGEFVDIEVELDEESSLWVTSAEVRAAAKKAFTQRQLNRANPSKQAGNWWVVSRKEDGVIKHYVVQAADRKKVSDNFKVASSGYESVAGPFSGVNKAVEASAETPTILYKRKHRGGLESRVKDVYYNSANYDSYVVVLDDLTGISVSGDGKYYDLWRFSPEYNFPELGGNVPYESMADGAQALIESLDSVDFPMGVSEPPSHYSH